VTEKRKTFHSAYFMAVPGFKARTKEMQSSNAKNITTMLNVAYCIPTVICGKHSM
jgi:hypothetical protein